MTENLFTKNSHDLVLTDIKASTNICEKECKTLSYTAYIRMSCFLI